MKRKRATQQLRFVGVILLCASFILTAVLAASKSAIGGADLPTLGYVFFRENGGVCALLACFGLCAMVLSCFINRKKR